jgi:hypothetical protein
MGKDHTTLLWAGLLAGSVKITISGLPNRVITFIYIYILNISIYYICYISLYNDEMGRTCGAYKGGKRDAQDVGGET